jgi:hypothetical protein
MMPGMAEQTEFPVRVRAFLDQERKALSEQALSEQPLADDDLARMRLLLKWTGDLARYDASQGSGVDLRDLEETIEELEADLEEPRAAREDAVDERDALEAEEERCVREGREG